MKDLDLMLREYEDARAAMVSAAGTTIMGHLQAAENVIRAADVLATKLRSMVVADGGPSRERPKPKVELTEDAARRARNAVGKILAEVTLNYRRGDGTAIDETIGAVVRAINGERDTSKPQHGAWPMAESCCCVPCLSLRRQRGADALVDRPV